MLLYHGTEPCIKKMADYHFFLLMGIFFARALAEEFTGLALEDVITNSKFSWLFFGPEGSVLMIDLEYYAFL